MSKRCVIYLRVSSEGQAAGQAGRFKDDEDEKYGLPRQEASCRAYAEQMGWDIVGVYTEVMSGAKIWERPTLTEIRHQFSKGTFDVLLVDSLDRLSRDTYHQGMIFSEAERYGIQWDSATEDIKDSPDGKMMQTIIGVFAEMERSKINERMYGGRVARMKSNKLPGMPMPTFGYRWADPKKSAFVIHEPEAEVVHMIFSLFEGGLSEVKTAARMNELGYRTAKGKKWASSAIHKVLTNTTYIGEIYGRKYTNITVDGKVKRALRPREEWIAIEGAAPPIIDTATFQRVQRLLEGNKKLSPRNSKDPLVHMLRGRVRCHQCGRLITSVSASGKDPAYYRHQPEHASLTNCIKIGIPQATLDGAVWTQITDFLLNPERLRRELEKRRENPQSNAALIESIETQMRKLKKQHETALGRFLMIEDDALSAGAKVLLDDLSKQIKSAEEELAILRAQDAARDAEQESVEELVANLSQFKERLAIVTPKQRQNLMAALDVQITLYPASHDVRWEGTFKISPTSIQTVRAETTSTDIFVLPTINRWEHNWTFSLAA